MKKTLILLALIATACATSAERLCLENDSGYPKSNAKMAVQWANTAQQVDEANKALLNQEPLDTSTLQDVTKTGKVKLDIPPSAQYFRVLIWTNGDKGTQPDMHTNWVDVVPDKIYKLKGDHLVPTVLMSGMGC